MEYFNTDTNLGKRRGGQLMATTSNFGWSTPDDTAYVKDGASAIRTLGSSVDSSMADLLGGTAGQILAKNTGTNMDFAWIDNEVMTNSTINAPFEKVNISATSATGTINVETGSLGSVWYYTSNATANFTLNFRTSNTVALNTTLATGEAVTVVFLNTNGATPYYPNAFQVDGNAVTPKWQGGTAPTSGNASSIDAYTFTIIKTASATFTVLAAAAKFA